MVSLSILTCFFATIVTVVNAQNVISVDVPNSKLLSKEFVNVTYTVVGSQTGTAQRLFLIKTNLTSVSSKSYI